jgi:hypothetical protein
MRLLYKSYNSNVSPPRVFCISVLIFWHSRRLLDVLITFESKKALTSLRPILVVHRHPCVSQDNKYLFDNKSWQKLYGFNYYMGDTCSDMSLYSSKLVVLDKHSIHQKCLILLIYQHFCSRNVS